MALLSKLWHRRPRLNKSRKSCLPLLPTELWMVILRYATEDGFSGPHGQLDASVSFLDVSSSHSDLLRRLSAYRLSLRCRALLTRVCRAWHAIVQDLLYDFVWVSRARQAKALAGAISHNPLLGATIRRLHIETPTLERCDPADLRTIIDHSPRLAAYSDYRSIRRQPHSSPDHLLSSLARPGNKLQRLSWTNYDYDTRDQSGCISFFLRLSPALGMAASDLDYLELSLCATDLIFPSTSLTSTAAAAAASHFPPNVVLGGQSVHLPALRTLKLTLDNIAFSVLAGWSMPALQNLSVLSTDFSYTGDGFARFFQVHGKSIVQLELGHSTGAIEEHYLTTTNTPASPPTQPSLNLVSWCPNLRQFICSADAEWNWQSPDWIAPHVLLPCHPHVELIGIRDMSKRLVDDLDLFLDRHRVEDFHHHHGPFFRLEEQLASLLRSQAFPRLQIVRDMSWESALMRRCQSMPIPGEDVFLGGGLVWDELEGSMREDQKEFGKALVRFWTSVRESCRDRGVVLQDWIGNPV